MQPAAKPSPSNVALRVANVMHQMGIDSLPRNYELVYEAYSGNNPDLARDFVALGPVKTQDVLDRLGQKYLPHHHEQGLVDRQNGVIRTEMSSFIGLLNREKTSLSDYNRVIGDVSKTISAEAGKETGLLSQSIHILRSATEQQSARNSAMVRTVVNQTAVLADLQRELDDEDAVRYLDPVTGMGNRRALNRELSKVYLNPELPTLCWLGIGEINDFEKASEQSQPAVINRFLRQVAKRMASVLGADDMLCRFDGARFAFLFPTSDEAEVIRAIDLVQTRVRSEAAKRPAGIRMSFGLCLSEHARNGFDLTSFAEKAAVTSRQTEGNPVTIYNAGSGLPLPKGWMIYKN